MSESSHVIVATCRDSAEAVLVRAILTAHEIPVHISGEHHAAMVGLGAAAIAQVVRVPREHAAEAAGLIDELRRGGAAALADDEIPEDDDAPREEVTAGGAMVVDTDDTLQRLGARKRTVLAVAVGLFLGHGTAHFSTRLWGRGAVLAGVQVMGWRALFVGNARLGGALVLAAMAMDIVGAVLHIQQTAPTRLPAARARSRRS